MSVEPYPIDITPSVLDVAALLRARTKDSNGFEVGTFSDDTRPTSSQVITLIDDAVVDIEGALGPTPPENLAGAGKSAAAMLTACLIELSYFPEQVQSSRSAFDQYWAMLQGKIRGLQESARGQEPGGMLITSTRIEVPWVDYIPALPVPLEVAGAAQAAQVGGIVAPAGPYGADVVHGRRDPAADPADPAVAPQDPLR